MSCPNAEPLARQLARPSSREAQRVDAELSRLGPVSARISALDGGPTTVHLVAQPAAHEALSAVIPALEATLAARGLPIHLRLGSADDHHA